jgi:hypothetical protein
MASLCAYCGKNPPIENSHILPRWTIRRSLAASVTGKLRPTDNINKRVQDGEKCPLLCSGCEGVFSQLETAAAKLFDAGSIAHGAAYDADFVRFLVSIVWRAASVRADELQAEHPRFAPALATALDAWKAYLSGAAADLGAHPVWFILLDSTLARQVHALMQHEAFDRTGAAPIINRYFANRLGCEIVVHEQADCALVWAKTGSWLIVGVIQPPKDSGGRTVELSVSGGTLAAAGQPVPPVILATLGRQSWECMKAASAMKPAQRQVIENDFKKNAAKVPGSEQHRALQEDVALFSDTAWVELPEPEAE